MSTDVSTTAEQRQGMRNAIPLQCCLSPALLAFSNGILLLYITAMGASNSSVLAYLSLFMLITAVTQLPLAFVADRVGKKRVGVVGGILMAVGFLILALAGSLGRQAELIAVVGIVVYSAAYGLHSAGWFALLSPLVPEAMRGRFFGRLRLSWQLCGFVFTMICTFCLSKDSPLVAFQWVMGVIAALLAVRMVFYLRIPELERPSGKAIGNVKAVLATVLRADGYASFCAYIFLLSLFTAGVPAIFGLVEKRVLGLGDNVVVALGVLTMVGSVLGFAVGGRMVDHRGPKSTFLWCHFGYGALLVLFLLRAFLPVPQLLPIALSHFLYGIFLAGSSIAISTEMLALVPVENKSISTSLCMTLLRIGQSLSGLLSAVVIKLNVIQPTWQLAGATFSDFDAVLLAYALMVVLLVVTLGLVPSVLRPSGWVPPG